MLPALTCLLLAQLAATPSPAPDKAASPAPSPAAPPASELKIRIVRVPYVEQGPREEVVLVCQGRIRTTDPAADPGLVQSQDPPLDPHIAVNVPCRPVYDTPAAKRK